MSRIHHDLEQLQTSYSAYGSSDPPDVDHDNEAARFHPQPRSPSSRPHLGGGWYQDLTPAQRQHLPNRGVTKDHGDHDPPPGGLIIHTVHEESKTRWSHIEDLDSFFKNVYTYYQKRGFKVMLLQVRR